MKISIGQLAFILLLAAVSYARPSRGQELLEKSININIENKTLGEVLKQIEMAAGVKFVYSRNFIKSGTLMNFQSRNEKLKFLLPRLFNPNKIVFEVVSEQLVLRNLTEQPNAEQPSSNEQTTTVSGKVTDEKGTPIPGVSVRIKNSNTGTSTDVNGNYRITLSQQKDILVFSYVGYLPQERVASTGSLDIKLIEETGNLNEVVVVGYGSQKRATVTAAISSVPMQELRDMPVSNVASAIQGKIAGVIVQQTGGAPGSTPAIKVRGLGSISANNAPLIVLDGNIVDSYVFSLLSTEEIERIDVLKDASSAAIYGSKGANGVLLVTTKKGKSGKTVINADVYAGVQQVGKKLDLLNSQQFAEFVKDASNTAYLDNVPGANINDPNSARPTSNLRYRYPRGDLFDWFNFDDPARVAALPYNDYQDLIFRDAAMANYQLTASGGNDKVSFVATGNYLKQDGIINGSSLDRYSVRANIDVNATERLKLGISINPSYKVLDEVRANGHWADNGIINSALTAAPLAPIYDADGNYSSQTALAAPYNWPGVTNPVANITEYHSKLITTNLLANAYASYAFLPELKYRISGNANINSNRRNSFRTSKIPLNQLLPPNVATGSAFSDQNLSLLFNQTLTYDKSFTGGHDLNILGGMEATRFAIDNSESTGSSYANDLIETLNGSVNGTTTTATSSRAINTSVSYFTRVGYTFKNRYLLNVSIRYDGSSIFAPEKRWGAFPAGSVGWRISEESYMKKIPMVSEAKIRASYGLSGNNSFPNNNFYPYLATLRSENYSFNNVLSNGLAPASLANSLLGWEKSRQFDLGLDLGLFNDRIFLVADYYSRITTDLLLNVNVPSLTGFNTAWKNTGRMQNKGFEFGLNTKNLVGNFKWNTSMNISTNKNKVLALGPTGDNILSGTGVGETNITMIGEPIGSFYGYRQIGIFRDLNDVNSYPHDATSRPGDAKFEDVNGDGRITAQDRTIIGNNQPDFIYSITNSISFKNFDFSIAFQGTQGGEILNLSRRFFENLEGGGNQYTTVLNRWRSPSEPGDGVTPRANARTSGNNNAVSSRWVEDGSYLRIQNISLGYRFPKRLLDKIKIPNARIYASGQNLVTWSDYMNYNPEVSNYESALTGGVDYGGYPLSRTFIIGLNIGF
ncbi:SusC/RagA family TonB-linked outer membrane protein [Pedobacter sp.]|uniref:SusC/RagA family TonB-linked outer membrane protein n=1 Tax=Pedobacter sp. TaxID=1411316 RepID=UPI003BA97616